MAESAVSVAGRIGELLVQEGNFLHGVSGQIELIQFELELMQMYLEDADKRQIQDKRVQTWISKIRETAYDVEDILETFLIKIGSRRRGGIKNAFKRCACIIHEFAELHKVGSQIEDIKSRITNLTRCLNTYSIKLVRECEEGHSSVIERQLQLRPFYSQWGRSYSYKFEEYTVGFDKSIEDLVEQLVNKEKDYRAVSICGVGGIGKTTLAKKVYQHQKIKWHFDSLTWAFISHQQFQRRNIWEGILFNLTSPTDEERERIKGLRDEEVAEELYQVQLQMKCLVILDDISTMEAWDSLRRAFPLGNSGSKILLTTRNREVAELVDPRGFLFEPRCLTEEEGWSLLQEKAFPNRSDGNIDEGMKKLGREMVKMCDGLPLAIALLGGILASKRTYEWKMVHDNIISYLSGKGHEQQQFGVNEILALNYYELPYQLKPCFLYLGHFPKDFNIPTKKLVRMWVAEGLVSSMQYEVRRAETLEEVAERYLGELLKRNMVQVGERGSTGRVKTCRLHNHMREVCLSKIVYNQDGNELMGGSLSSMVTNAKLSHRIHRIAIQYKEENFSLKRERAPYLRSLLVLGASVFDNELCNFKLLRVLDLEAHGFGKLSRAIGDLIHLRYLNFKFDEASKVIIPSSIGNLKFLQTLIINIDHGSSRFFFEVPNVIWKIEQLRHLCLPYCQNKNSVKLRLDNLRELQTLKNFDARNFDVKELAKLSNLRELKIVSLSSLKVLEGKIVKLLEYFKFPPNLTKLSLENSELEEDPMATLEKLPNLTLLRLLSNAFKGKKMICSENGFPQLKFLQLNGLGYLEEWRVHEKAMRSLCKLEIKYCMKLKMVPDGLEFITTLREFHIFGMPEEFKKRVKEGGEDYQRLEHVPSIRL